jgi:hypothetical protein
MSAASTLANGWLLENPGDKVYRPQLFRKFPTFRILHKRARAFSGSEGGRYKLYSVESSPGVGSGPTFARAQQNAIINQYGNSPVYQVPPISYYGYASIPAMTWAQAADDEYSFITAFDKSMKDATARMMQDIAPQVFGAGALGIGTIAAISTTTTTNDTITLTTNLDGYKFYEQTSFLDAAASPNSGNYRSRASASVPLQVTGVDRVAGKLFFAAQNVTSVLTGLSVGDTLFNATDDTSVGLSGLIGLEAICPFGGVTNQSDSFYNVNRSVSNLLYGVSYDGSNDSDVVQMINNARTRSKSVVQGEQDLFALNPQTFNKMRKQLMTQNRYTTKDIIVSPVTGYSDLQEETISGIDIGGAIAYEDVTVPATRCWGFMQEDLDYNMLNDGLVPWDFAGSAAMPGPIAGRDTVEFAFAAYHNTFVKNPKNLLNIKVNASNG